MLKIAEEEVQRVGHQAAALSGSLNSLPHFASAAPAFSAFNQIIGTTQRVFELSVQNVDSASGWFDAYLLL